MPRNTAADQITDTLITAHVAVLKPLAGWGVITDTLGHPIDQAVYPQLDTPFPMEPFPSAYCFVSGYSPDYSQGLGIHIDTIMVTTRIIGGQATQPGASNPEHLVYQMLTGTINQLSYYRFYENPSTGVPLSDGSGNQYIAPEGKVTVRPLGRITNFVYAEQGAFVGIDVISTVMLTIHIGRFS